MIKELIKFLSTYDHVKDNKTFIKQLEDIGHPLLNVVKWSHERTQNFLILNHIFKIFDIEYSILFNDTDIGFVFNIDKTMYFVDDKSRFPTLFVSEVMNNYKNYSYMVIIGKNIEFVHDNQQELLLAMVDGLDFHNVDSKTLKEVFININTK